jgi:hypothetical protein
MIIRFDLVKCLNFYRQGTLEKWAIDPAGELYADKWMKFAIGLLKGRPPGHRSAFSFVDRTGAVPSIVKNYIAPDQLIPTGKPSSWDYLDICLERAQQLLDTNKHLTMLWSGGVDSTLALFSVIRQAQHRDQVSILCTFESIIESGKIFDTFLKDSGIRIKFDQTRVNRKSAYTYDHEDPSQLYITGGCGDQLFGKPVSLAARNSNPSDPWHTGFSKEILDIIEPSIALSERPINTVRDLRWWIFFNHTWTTAMNDDMVGRPAHVGQRIHAFYTTPEFQRWAIHTPTYYEDQDKYRWPAKQALAKLIDYPYYIQHKTKSLGYTWKYDPNWYMLDRDFNTYYHPI